MDIALNQPSPFPGTATLTSDDAGSTYTAGYYYGHPWGFSSLTPSSQSSYTPSAPFVYLNLFVEGDFTIDRMVISGDGFEFDNVVTSTNAQTIAGDLVFAKNITVTAPPPTTEPPADPGTPSAGNAGLPDTGLVVATVIGIALVGAFLFFAAGGAFSSRTRLRNIGIDLEVKNKLNQMSASFERMDRLRKRRRR